LPFKRGIATLDLVWLNNPIFVESATPASTQVVPPSVVFSIIIWSAGKKANLFALLSLINVYIVTSFVPFKFLGLVRPKVEIPVIPEPSPTNFHLKEEEPKLYPKSV
jgi:hypothetical protein